jgi:hypothetical protein
VIYFKKKELLILDNALILCLQAFRVDELVSKRKTASFAGAESMERLQNATIYIHSEANILFEDYGKLSYASLYSVGLFK